MIEISGSYTERFNQLLCGEGADWSRLSRNTNRPIATNCLGMKFTVPRNGPIFEIPDEWWAAGAISGLAPSDSHYVCASVYAAVPLEDIEPPLRDGGKIWFRDRDTVVRLLNGMCEGSELPPIQVWSKEKKSSARHILRDGFHRFYLSVAIGYNRIPIEVEDFDLDEFLANESKG